jgi:hypothetical protein
MYLFFFKKERAFIILLIFFIRLFYSHDLGREFGGISRVDSTLLIMIISLLC